MMELIIHANMLKEVSVHGKVFRSLVKLKENWKIFGSV